MRAIKESGSRVVYIGEPARCLIGAAADPLSIRAVFDLSRHWGDKARSRDEMAALLIILCVTIGLAVRAGTYSRTWSPADAESPHETGLETSLIDTCARTFILVLLSLLGLLALGVMYGNVLGSANASP